MGGIGGGGLLTGEEPNVDRNGVGSGEDEDFSVPVHLALFAAAVG